MFTPHPHTHSLLSLERRFNRPWLRQWAYQSQRLRIQIPLFLSYLLRRSWDFCAVLCALVMGWPLWLAIALAIKLTDGGPVLYWQRRVGFRGREFAFPKFRSMRINAEAMAPTLINQHSDQRTFKQKNDPRITAVGRLIRRFSLDEVPQLWCVLKGEMTLVGPRPPLPKEVKLYNLDARQRLEITPGLSCIWQISGRSEIPFEGQLAMDLYYIRHRSLRLDITILLKTLPAVLIGRGAY